MFSGASSSFYAAPARLAGKSAASVAYRAASICAASRLAASLAFSLAAALVIYAVFMETKNIQNQNTLI